MNIIINEYSKTGLNEYSGNGNLRSLMKNNSLLQSTWNIQVTFEI